jgi:hypothetical protein
LGAFLQRIASKAEHARNGSLYKRLFRTPRAAVALPDDLSAHQEGRLGLAGEHVPHPFVLRMQTPSEPGEDRRIRDGESVGVEMVLMEEAVSHVPALTAAFESMGEDGLGQRTSQPDGAHQRGTVTLRTAELDLGGIRLDLYEGEGWRLPGTCSPALFDRADQFALGPQERDGPPRGPLRVQFLTPFRQKHAGDIVRPNDVTPAVLAAACYRRLVALSLCYGPEPLGAEAIERVRTASFALSDATSIAQSSLRWVADRRYSHRQEHTHPVGGIVGTVTLDGTGPARRTWHALLRKSQTLHLGKKTAIGHGRIVLN